MPKQPNPETVSTEKVMESILSILPAMGMYMYELLALLRSTGLSEIVIYPALNLLEKSGAISMQQDMVVPNPIL